MQICWLSISKLTDNVLCTTVWFCGTGSSSTLSILRILARGRDISWASIIEGFFFSR